MARRIVAAAAITLAALGWVSSAAAQNIYWNGTGSTWNSTGDWWTTPGGTTPVPSFSGATIIANFNANGVTSAQAITLDANQIVQGLVFTGTDLGGETISSGGAGTNTLTIGASGIVVNANSGADSITNKIVLSSSQTWSNYSANTLSVSGNIGESPAGQGLIFGGSGTVALSGSNTYTGPTTITNGGTLLLDFTGGTAPITNIINNGISTGGVNNITSGSGLVLAGGTLRINISGNPNEQAFNGTTVNAGASMLTATNVGFGSAALDLGAITRNVGSGVNFNQSTGTALSFYTTTANRAFTGGTNPGTILGGWAVFTQGSATFPNTWATSASNGTSAGLITDFEGYTTVAAAAAIPAGLDLDITGAPAVVATSVTVNSMRFNTAAAFTVTGTAGQTITVASGGILVTNQLAGNTDTMATGNLTSGNGADLIVNQYNPATPNRSLSISQVITDNGTPVGLTKNGPGQLNIATGSNTFTGNVYINSGSVQTGSGFNNTSSLSAFGALGTANAGRTITVGPGAVMHFTTNNVLAGSQTSNVNAANKIPGVVINGGTFSSTRYNALGNITLNSGAVLNTSATDGTGTAAYQGFQFLGSITVGGTSGSSIISSNGAGDQLFPTSRGGTTFNVAATGGTGPDLTVAAPLINASNDYNDTGLTNLATPTNIIKNGAGTMRVTRASTYSGGTTINAGRVAVAGSSSALGTGTITLSGGNLQLQGIATGSIGIQFGGNGHGTSLTAAQTAGVPFVAMTNWNTAGGTFATTGNIANLVNSAGALSGTSVSWANSPDVFQTGSTSSNANATADNVLMSGYLDSNNFSNRPAVTFSGIPYSQYAAYVYTGSDTANRGQAATNSQNSTTYYYSTNANTSFPINYRTTLNTDNTKAPNANYVVFSGLNNTANGNQITFQAGTGNGPIAGNSSGGITAIEIVNTVPNSSLVMGNNVTMTADATIDVTGFSSDSITGLLTIGSNNLFVTGGSTGANAAYSLSLGTVGGVTLSGNPTFDVANNGTGVGTLSLGGLNDGGTARTITKQNAGTLTLTAGGTMVAGSQVNVTGGTLRVASAFLPANPATGSAPVTVFTGATLAGPSVANGVGTLAGAVTVNTGGSLAGGSPTGIAVLNLTGGLTLQTGTSSNITLSTTPNGSADPTLAVFALGAGSLLVNGSHVINLSGLPPVQANSTYDLFSYGGTQMTSTSPSGTTLTFTNNGSGSMTLGGSLPESNFLNYTLVNGNFQIDLAVTFKGLTWTGRAGGTGAVTGTWDNNTTNNWADSTPAPATFNNQGVLFGDKNPLSVPNNVGTSAITISTGGVGVSPGTVLFTNSGSPSGVDYSFSGDPINDFSMTSPTGMTLNGTGGVTLQSANNFSGPVTINAGHLQLQNGTALGNSSGVTVASGTALELASGSGTTTTYGTRADSTGTIPLTLAGAGRTGNAAGALNSVSGINTYAGPITIDNTNPATIESSSGANGDGLTLTGAVFAPRGVTVVAVGGVTFSGGIGIGATAALNISGGGPVVSNTAPISGSAGSIIYTGTGTGSLTFAVDNSYSGSTTINSNSLILNTANGLGNSSGVIEAATGGPALVLNNTSGNPAKFGTQPLFPGGTIPLTLNGAGNAGAAGALASISGNNTYAGAVTVGAGGATVASTSATTGDGLTLTGGVSIPNNATLTFVGAGNAAIPQPSTITGGGAVRVNAGATGTVAISGVNSFGGGTTIQQGTLAVGFSNSVLGSGAVTLAGGRLQLQAVSGAPSGKKIGINFEGGQGTSVTPPTNPTSLAATDTAGVVPQINWNNSPGNTGTSVDSPVNGTIVDSTGVPTAVSISYASNNIWSVGQPTLADGNHKLMNGYLDLNQAGGTTTSVTLSNLPYAFYNVYAYVGSDGNNRIGHGTINGQSIYATTNDNPFGGYVQATGTSQATSIPSNYLLFSGVGGSTLTYLQNGDTGNFGLHGIQIVDTTAPIALPNSVAVTASSTVDVTGFASASLAGPVTIGSASGAIQLNVTGAGAGLGSNYSLALGSSLTLNGSNTNYIFDVAPNSTGSGTGTVTPGTLSGGATARTVTVQNTGTLVLSVPSTLAAGSTVNVGPVGGGNGGNLRVTNTSGSATGTAAVNVNSGGALLSSTAAGQGFITGGVTLNSGGAVTGGTGTTLTLSGGLTLQGGSSSTFNLGVPVNGTANPALAFVATSGALPTSLTINGSHTINLTGAPPVQVTSTYDLFSYTGTQLSQAQFANFTLGGSLPQSNVLNYQLVNGTNQVDLKVSLIAYTWTGQDNGTGAANGSWDVGTSVNWANVTPAATTYTDNTLPVVFGDKNPLSPGGTGPVGTSTVTIQPAGVSPASVLFTNSGPGSGGVDYLFNSSSGSINDSTLGPTSLVLNGTGQVRLLAQNTFSGPVLINAGHLDLENTTALGNTTGVTVAAGGALELAASSGTAAVFGQTQNGSGTIPLTLNGTGLAASPAGALNSASGIISYSGPISVGVSGAATIASNSNSNGDQLNLIGGINLSSGAALSIGGIGRTVIANSPVSVGAGGGTINSTGAQALMISSGVLISAGSTFTVGGSGAAIVNASPINDLAGAGALIYSGTGTGSLTLAVDNLYHGSATVNSNSMILTTANGLGNSSGATVNAGGALVLNNSSGSPITFGGGTSGTPVPLTVNGVGDAGAAGALASVAGANTYAGAITVGSTNAATIVSTSTTSGDGLALQGTLTVPTGGTLTFAGQGTTTVGVRGLGTITGAGGVAVNAAGGTVNFTTANSYGGGAVGTQVSNGTLAVASNAALGNGPLKMSGGRLQLQTVPGTPIGVKFATGRTGETNEQLSGAAGAPGAVANSWNNVLVNADSNNPQNAPPAAPGASGIPFALLDGNGAATTASLAQYASANTYAVYGATQNGAGGIGTGIQQLMNSYIDNNAAAGPTTNNPAIAGVSGLTYGKYDVYVYFGSDGNGRSGAVNLYTGSTDTTGTLAGTFYYTTDANHGATTAYELTTNNTGSAYPLATYAIFAGQNASSFALDTIASGTAINHTGIFGLEILPYVGAAVPNAVTVTANSTIDVTGPSSAAITGSLSIGSNTLFVTGGSTGTDAPYSLALGATTLSGDPTFDVANNGSGTGTLRLASLNDGAAARTITKVNSGTLEIQGASTLTGGTSIKANVGTLRFNNQSGAATVGALVTATVAPGATLELAGNVSDLSSPSPASARVNVTNNSKQSSGGSLLVSGTNQQVGAITGTGDTVVNASASLTANSIVQNALVIGGTDATHTGLVTIAASDASGNPLSSGSGMAVAGALAPSEPFGGGATSASDLAPANAEGTSGDPIAGPTSASQSGSTPAVPEPSSWVLLAIAGLASLAAARRRRQSIG